MTARQARELRLLAEIMAPHDAQREARAAEIRRRSTERIARHQDRADATVSERGSAGLLLLLAALPVILCVVWVAGTLAASVATVSGIQ